MPPPPLPLLLPPPPPAPRAMPMPAAAPMPTISPIMPAERPAAAATAFVWLSMDVAERKPYFVAVILISALPAT